MQLYQGQEFSSGKNCFYSSVANLLKLIGVSYLESEYYFLSKGLDCRYIKQDEDNWVSSLEFLPYDSMLHNLFNALNLRIVVKQPPFDFADLIHSFLSRGSPVLLCVKPSYLNYHTIVMNQLTYVHFIVVTGLDLTKNLAYVIDSYVLNREGDVNQFLNWYDLHDLETGCLGFAALDSFPVTQISQSTIKQIVLSALTRFLSNKEDVEPCYGNSAIINSFKNLEKSLAINERLEMQLGIIMHLKTRFFCVFSYLGEYLTSVGIDQFTDLLEGAHEQWLSLCVTLLMSYFRNESSYFRFTIQQILHHSRYQSGLFDQIKEALSIETGSW